MAAALGGGVQADAGNEDPREKRRKQQQAMQRELAAQIEERNRRREEEKQQRLATEAREDARIQQEAEPGAGFFQRPGRRPAASCIQAAQQGPSYMPAPS